MPKVKVDKFCGLSTSPSWQAWLIHTDISLYRKFRLRLQESRGCNQNRDIMVELLKELEQIPGATEKLFEFLKKHYPYMIVDESVAPSASPIPVTDAGPIFPHFNASILTYPRRQVFEGPNLQKRLQEFLLDKIKSDSVIVDGKAYVEYLERGDAALVDKVPQKNWQIAAWRLRVTGKS